LRHTFSTRLVGMNVPIKVVHALMDHGDFKTTMNIYAEIMAESMSILVKERNWDENIFPCTSKTVTEQDSVAIQMMSVWVF